MYMYMHNELSKYLQASQRDEETKDVITSLKYSEDAQISQDTLQSTFLDKNCYVRMIPKILIRGKISPISPPSLIGEIFACEFYVLAWRPLYTTSAKIYPTKKR